MLIMLVRLLIHVIMILPFAYYIEIATYSFFHGTGNCIIHTRSHNHVDRTSTYIITIISIHISIIICYQQQHASIAMSMTVTMIMTCTEIVIVWGMS